MALVFNHVTTDIGIGGIHGRIHGIIDIVLDNAYPDGGWPITATNLNLHDIFFLIPPQASPTSFFGLVWNSATSKLMCLEATGNSGAAIEYDSANDGLDGDVIRCYYEGK
jgi:hypothetical protein